MTVIKNKLLVKEMWQVKFNMNSLSICMMKQNSIYRQVFLNTAVIFVTGIIVQKPTECLEVHVIFSLLKIFP